MIRPSMAEYNKKERELLNEIISNAFMFICDDACELDCRKCEVHNLCIDIQNTLQELDSLSQ